MIELSGIGKRYGERWVLRGMCLQVPRRGIVGVVGPSGIGKTTLSRLIMRLEEPDEGRVDWDGDLRLSVMFPQDRLLPLLSVEQNFRYVGIDQQQMLAALDGLDLLHVLDQRPETLSTGMSRRIAFARAYCHPADLLVLDEPFKGLDEDAREAVAAMIIQAGKNRAVLLIDHNLDLVGDLAEPIIQLRTE